MQEYEVPFEFINASYIGYLYKSNSEYRGMKFESHVLITGIKVGRNNEGIVKHIVINPDEPTETLLVDGYTESITVAWKD